MAKMFYTLEETKKALGVDENAIRQMTREGRLREFRDGPRLMFKADQVDDLKGFQGDWRKGYTNVGPIFWDYEGMNGSGQEVRGTVEAATSESAIAMIRAKGYFPTKCRQSKKTQAVESNEPQSSSSSSVQQFARPGFPDIDDDFPIGREEIIKLVSPDTSKRLEELVPLIAAQIIKMMPQPQQPKPSKLWRLMKTVFFIAFGFGLGFVTCLFLFAK